MQTKYLLVSAVIIALAACSEKPPPKKIMDIGSANDGAAFYLYRPGGILEDYITLEIAKENDRGTLLSIPRCSYAAAKIEKGIVNVVLFEADFSFKSSEEIKESKSNIYTTAIIRIVDTAPTMQDIGKLNQDSFTVVHCKL